VASRITELVLDARDPELLARFWCEVLGYVELERDEAGIEIGPPGVGSGGPQPTIVLSRTDEPKTGKLRLHIDVNATDREQDDELERLLAAGARPADIGQTGAESWHVLADPEGNEFCLLRRRVPEVQSIDHARG
jgi:catechol-2,3-dioxygenase